MSILADHQIRRLCTLPNFVITTNVPVKTIENMAHFYPRPVESFSYMSEEEIQKEIRNTKRQTLDTNIKNISGLVDYRTLSQEEIDNFKPMLTPYEPGQVKVNDKGEKILSYGTSSFGYDLRIAPKFKIFTNINHTVIDPKNFDEKSFVDFEGDMCIVPPNSFVLAHSMECFDMPVDVCGVVVGKSTYARTGINCLCTPVEPGWKGYLTLEFSNTTPLPAKLYANEGGCQVMFFRGETPDVTYANRSGKYQEQPNDIVLPKV
jgi:dCTP deaminase